MRFRAGMEALAAADAAPDREAREGRLGEAVAAFRAILVDRPELMRVRLELARAFFLKEEDTLARRHFEQVLAGDVPPAVAANIRRFLDIIRARRRWEAWFGAAIVPDSNLNAASGERTVFLDTPFGRLPFTLDDPAKPESGLGVSLLGRRRIPASQHPLTDRLRLRAGADASVREYRGGEFDRHFLLPQAPYQVSSVSARIMTVSGHDIRADTGTGRRHSRIVASVESCIARLSSFSYCRFTGRRCAC